MVLLYLLRLFFWITLLYIIIYNNLPNIPVGAHWVWKTKVNSDVKNEYFLNRYTETPFILIHSCHCSYQSMIKNHSLKTSLQYTTENNKRLSTHPEERQVTTAIDAGDLQVAHHHLAVLVIFAKGPILLVQVWQSAQFIFCAGAYCRERMKEREKLHSDDINNRCTNCISDRLILQSIQQRSSIRPEAPEASKTDKGAAAQTDNLTSN